MNPARKGDRLVSGASAPTLRGSLAALKTSLSPFLVAALLTVTPEPVAAVGDDLVEPHVFDADDHPVPFPDFGEKVLAVFYTDADVADLNDPLVDTMKARHLDASLCRGVGVVNLEDSKPPNFVIRAVIRGKNQRWATSILTDPAHGLASAWHLGDCNNQSVVMAVGKDKKLKYLHRGAVRGDDIEAFISLIETLNTQ